MAQWQQINPGAKRHAPADHGGLSQQQQWIKEGQGHGQMIADPKRVKPGLIYRLDKPHELIDLRQPLAGLVIRLAMDSLDADLEIGIEGQWHGLSVFSRKSVTDLHRQLSTHLLAEDIDRRTIFAFL